MSVFLIPLEDEAFRQALLSSPHRALKDTFGVELPRDKTLHVLEQSPENMDFVIPLKPDEITQGMTKKQIVDRLTQDMPKVSEKISQRMNVYGNILAALWAEPELVEAFKADPKAFIRDRTGADLDEITTIVVRVEDDQNEYIVLPVLGTDSELTDEELELVSGGLAAIFAGTGILGAVATIVLMVSAGMLW